MSVAAQSIKHVTTGARMIGAQAMVGGRAPMIGEGHSLLHAQTAEPCFASRLIPLPGISNWNAYIAGKNKKCLNKSDQYPSEWGHM